MTKKYGTGGFPIGYSSSRQRAEDYADQRATSRPARRSSPILQGDIERSEETNTENVRQKRESVPADAKDE